MGVCVAEYLGVRTNQDMVKIEPCSFAEKPKCPFATDNKCKKCISENEPICSVRNSDNIVWINCSERLCSTKKDLPFCSHQKDILLQIARTIFSPSVQASDVCVKREVRLLANRETKYNADYIMTLKEGRTNFSGPDRLIVEMQGGGETSNTGELTNQVKLWRNNSERTNQMLRQIAAASTLETNAWRRQQEQFIVKGNVAMKTWKGYGICFCVGVLLYDYLMTKMNDVHLPNLREHNWNLAILTFKEDLESSDNSLHFVIDESRMLFTNYQTFVQALINQGEPTRAAFQGEFTNLNNEQVTIDP